MFYSIENANNTPEYLELIRLYNAVIKEAWGYKINGDNMDRLERAGLVFKDWHNKSGFRKSHKISQLEKMLRGCNA